MTRIKLTGTSGNDETQAGYIFDARDADAQAECILQRMVQVQLA